MLKHLLLLALIIHTISCNDTDTDTKMEYHQIDCSIIESDWGMLPTTAYSNFSYDVAYNTNTQKIKLLSHKIMGQHRIEYQIILSDTAGTYSPAHFSLTNNDYPYVESFFVVDGERVDIMTTETTGNHVEPAMIWYEANFSIAAKHYTNKGADYFLIQGLDPYCNGNQCTSYQVFVIWENKEGFQAESYYFSGKETYSFEEMYLLDKDRDGKPELNWLGE